MSMPRSAKDSPFPYSASQVCYLALDGAGRLTQVPVGGGGVPPGRGRGNSGSMPSGRASTAATSL